MTLRVRFAPSPTGQLHMGGARTALFNWLYARHHGGQFVLRIEDTDKARSTEESAAGIIDGLTWLGIESDEPIVFQSQQMERHIELANQLVSQGHAYRCYCTPERLDTLRKAQVDAGQNPRYDRHCYQRTDAAPAADTAYSVRFVIPRDGVTALNDLVKGPITVNNVELDDLIILRSDGTPTYNFVVVCDDADMRISHVIRGDDHLSNTFKQLHIYRALGHEPPKFGHLPLIKGLSKRLGSASVQDYRDRGFLVEATLNYIARLGWSHGDDEILSREELIAIFDLDGTAKAAAQFDEAKFIWLNEHYLKALPAETVAQRWLPFLAKQGFNEPEVNERVLGLVRALRPRAKTLVDMAQAASFAYTRPSSYDDGAVKKWIGNPTLMLLLDLADALAGLTDFRPETLESFLRAQSESRSLNLGQIAQPIRVCLTGTAVSPPLHDVLAVLGQEEAVARIRNGVETLTAKLQGAA